MPEEGISSEIGGVSTDRRALDAVNLALRLLSALILPVLLLAQEPKAAPGMAEKDLPSLLAAAKDALDREDFPAAVEALSVVVGKEPEMAAAWFNLAYAYGAMGRNEEAAKAYEKTLEIHPNLFEARLNLGILLIQEEHADAALEHLAKAVELKPEHARGHLYYGRALQMAGQSPAAEKQFEESLRLDPRSAIAHFDLGQLRLSAKDHAGALEHFRKAREINPDLAPARLGLALALEGVG
ncbi:MAG: tetratricopeptide repeat protein, partial [Acidobacteria bacterium]|nr:tetratricopeptide repeat protein [Acidobacteriota bacterium]